MLIESQTFLHDMVVLVISKFIDFHHNGWFCHTMSHLESEVTTPSTSITSVMSKSYFCRQIKIQELHFSDVNLYPPDKINEKGFCQILVTDIKVAWKGNRSENGVRMNVMSLGFFVAMFAFQETNMKVKYNRQTCSLPSSGDKYQTDNRHPR